MKLFQSTSRTTMGDEVFNQFVQLLSRGAYKPGEKLPTEMEMCEQLQVSRPVLREVTRALCHMGYLTSVQGGGIYISKVMEPFMVGMKLKLALKEVQLLEVWELRYILESSVAGIVAERGLDEELEEIWNAMLEYERNVKENADESLIIAASKNFHNSIARAAHNEVVLDVLANVAQLLSMSRELSIRVEESSNRAVDFHRRIAQAIVDRDVTRAKSEMELHLLDVKNDLLICMERMEKQS